MALLFTDGFDLYTNNTDFTNSRGWVRNGSQAAGFQAGTGRYGGGCIGVGPNNGSDELYYNLYGERDAIETALNQSNGISDRVMCYEFATKVTVAGSGGYWSAFCTPTRPIFAINSSTNGIKVRWTAFGQVLVEIANSTTSYTSSACSINDGNWHWISLALKKKRDATGLAIVYVDGVKVLDQQNIVTCISDPEACGGFGFNDQATIGSNQFLVDDIIVYDDQTSGIAGDITYANSFPIGDCRIETVTVTGNGSTNGWTPLASTNASQVDEDVPDDATSYVSETVEEQTDLYTFDDMTNTPSTIECAMVHWRARSGDGTSGLVGAVKSGTTEAQHITSWEDSQNGRNDDALTTWEGNCASMPRNPDTETAWTESTINAAEFGIYSKA